MKKPDNKFLLLIIIICISFYVGWTIASTHESNKPDRHLDFVINGDGNRMLEVYDGGAYTWLKQPVNNDNDE